VRIQLARVPGPDPPRLPSTRMMSNAPGAPTLPRGNVVVFVAPKHGQPLVPFSFGCLRLTPIGATYCALCSNEARAVAFEPTPTWLTPKSLVKTPLAVRCTCTLTVSLALYGLELMVTSPELTPPPFLPAYWTASV